MVSNTYNNIDFARSKSFVMHQPNNALRRVRFDANWHPLRVEANAFTQREIIEPRPDRIAASWLDRCEGLRLFEDVRRRR